jgi:hypothetical protein
METLILLAREKGEASFGSLSLISQPNAIYGFKAEHMSGYFSYLPAHHTIVAFNPNMEQLTKVLSDYYPQLPTIKDSTLIKMIDACLWQPTARLGNLKITMYDIGDDLAYDEWMDSGGLTYYKHAKYVMDMQEVLAGVVDYLPEEPNDPIALYKGRYGLRIEDDKDFGWVTYDPVTKIIETDTYKAWQGYTCPGMRSDTLVALIMRYFKAVPKIVDGLSIY